MRCSGGTFGVIQAILYASTGPQIWDLHADSRNPEGSSQERYFRPFPRTTSQATQKPCPYRLPWRRQQLHSMLEGTASRPLYAPSVSTQDFFASNLLGLRLEMLYEILLKNTDPTLVVQEMDWGWAVAAKQDPVEWFKKYPGRFELAHVKDVDNDDDKKSTIIGQGKVDFPTILDNIKKGGVKYLIVEIEDYEKSPLEDAKVCYKNFHKLVRELN